LAVECERGILAPVVGRVATIVAEELHPTGLVVKH